MFKEFMKYYKMHKGLFLLDFVSAFFVAILDLVFPYLVKVSIDDILPSGNTRMFFIFMSVLLIINITRSFLFYVVTYWGHVLGLRIEYEMRKRLFSHVQKLSFSYFDNNKTGAIMSKVVNDLNEVSELAHHGPEDVFIASIMLIGAMFAMGNMNIKLTVAVFLLLPIMIYFSYRQNRKMRSAFRETRVKIAEINSQVEDSISGIRVVKAFANEKHEKKKFETGNRGFKDIKEETYEIMGRFFSGIHFFTNSIQILVVAYGGYLFFQGELTIGMLVGFLLYSGRFIEPIRKMMGLTEMYQRGLTGFNRFYSLMNTEAEIEDRKNPLKIINLKGNIKFENVHFAYKSSDYILKKFDLEIKEGENVALVGPSGAGKTTICSLIPRFYDVLAGRILIDDKDIRDIAQESLRKNIGIVQQDIFLFNGSVKENIAYGDLEASDEEIINAAKEANLYEFIISLENGFDTFVGERGVKLSGGQKQRIAIARIFLKNPKILILDEATSALDNETEKLIQESLYRLTKGRTTITIAHRLTTVRNADRIIVIDKDGISESGDHETLINKDGVYKKLYNAQFKGFIPDII